MEKTRKPLDLPWLIVVAGIGLLACILYRNLLLSQYIMDEFQQASMAATIHGGALPYRDYPADKTVLGTFLYVLPTLLSDRTAMIVLLCRHMALVYAAVTLIVVCFLYRHIFGQVGQVGQVGQIRQVGQVQEVRQVLEVRSVRALGPLLVVFWTLSCSNFLEHSFSIRVDMLMTMFALAGVYLYIAVGSWRGAALAGILLCLAFCSTQKAAYFIVAFTAAFLLAGRKGSERPLRDFAVYAAAGATTFVVYALVFGQGLYFLTVFRNTFFSKAAMGVALNSEYGDMSIYYFETFRRNPIFYGFAISGLLVSIWRWRSSSWERNFLTVFTYILFLFMLAHRSPWPYVFVTAIPLFGLYAAFISEKILERLGNPRLKWAAASAVLLVVFSGAVVRHHRHLRVTNALQYRVLQASEAILAPDDTYYDATAMLSTRHHANNDVILVRVILLRVLEAWERERVALIDSLRKAQCKLIIHNYRIGALPEDFVESFIAHHYVLFDTNLFVAGAMVTKTPHEVDLIWGGKYVLVPKGKPADIRLDGRVVEPLHPIDLIPGKHEIRYSGPGSLLLIPVEAHEYMKQYDIDPRLDKLYDDVYSI